MTFFKKYLFQIVTLILFVLFLSFSFIYNDYIKVTENKILISKYKRTAKDMKDRVSTLLLVKEKSTLAIAISLASNDRLQDYILKRKIPKKHYANLIQKYKDSTLYKNIWIQVMDKNGLSLYRSWTKNRGDNLSNIRKEISILKKDSMANYAISIGRYDFSIKAMAPIFNAGKLIGFVEIISHFNSIAKILKNENIASVILADKVHSKHLTHPFTKMFLGEYYIANYTAPKKFRDILLKYGVENFFNNKYVIKDNYFIVDYPLKCIKGETIGHYIIFKKLNSIQSKDLEHFQFKWIMLLLFFIVSVVSIVNIIIFYVMKKQKIYYKNIIDSSYNIILINNKKNILDVNKTFFKYFTQYKTLDEFRKEHKCICDFFVKEDGYLAKGNETYSWLDEVLNSTEKIHKVKMNINGGIYYFLVNTSIISKDKKHYSVIFSDITKEEIYKNELEKETVTDPLTGIKNRRFYESKMKSEIVRADRYNEPLSIIMLDIDHFKLVNDKYGHDVGDKVLIEYTKLISSIIRDTDIFCRVGGEEFIIITPHTTVNDAYKLAEKIRKAVEESKEVLPITMSFGVTQHKNNEDKDDMFKRVDKALYDAKGSGRNRVVMR